MKCVVCLLSGRPTAEVRDAEFIVNGFSICYDEDDEAHWNAAAMSGGEYHLLVMEARRIG